MPTHEPQAGRGSEQAEFEIAAEEALRAGFEVCEAVGFQITEDHASGVIDIIDRLRSRLAAAEAESAELLKALLHETLDSGHFHDNHRVEANDGRVVLLHPLAYAVLEKHGLVRRDGNRFVFAAHAAQPKEPA